VLQLESSLVTGNENGRKRIYCRNQRKGKKEKKNKKPALE
jgi:hypothetical protein